MNHETKTLSYRGGIVRFRLPMHWREEYAPEGGGIFYDTRPDSGTLRLNVISAESKNGEPPELGIERLFSAGGHDLLSNGLRMRYRKVAGEERGTALLLYRWEIGVPIPPSRIRIVCFTYAIRATQDSDPAIQAELALIDESVRSAEFSREPGV